MPYSQFLAARIRQIFEERQVFFEEKEMMGGLVFMVNEKMCCGISYNKQKQTDLLMARVGQEVYQDCLKRAGALPMDFTGKSMKGFIFVTPEGFDLDQDLEYWIALCLAYNPFAKRSNKRK